MATEHNIYIKNMVCDRCITAVRSTLERLGTPPVTVVLGRAELDASPTPLQRQNIAEALSSIGFELIEDPRIRTAEHIKRLIIELIHHPDKHLRTNLSHYLSEQCHHDYSALSKLFSETQNTTIEKYFIAQKIERVKELLEYGEMNLNEIAHHLNYSSTSHLSTQFKMLTGLTPRQYKMQKPGTRLALDKVQPHTEKI